MEINRQLEHLLLAISSLDTSIEFYSDTIPKLAEIHREVTESFSIQPRWGDMGTAFQDLQNQLEWMENLRSDYLETLAELAKNAGAESSLTRT